MKKERSLDHIELCNQEFKHFKLNWVIYVYDGDGSLLAKKNDGQECVAPEDNDRLAQMLGGADHPAYAYITSHWTPEVVESYRAHLAAQEKLDNQNVGE